MVSPVVRPAPVIGPVRIAADDGRFAQLSAHQVLWFGRDATADLSFPDSSRQLSREAGQIVHRGDGVSVTNLSRVHALRVHLADKRRLTLHALESDQPAAVVLLHSGTHVVETPGWQTHHCRLTIDIPTSTGTPEHLDPIDGEADREETVMPVKLNTDTKEFATALLLCKPKLEHGPTAGVPSVPDLTRSVLELTNSFAELFEFDAARGYTPGIGEPRTAYQKSTARVHAYLKEIRRRLKAKGLDQDVELSGGALADALIEYSIIRPSHLNLLEDERWIAKQEKLAWDREGDQ